MLKYLGIPHRTGLKAYCYLNWREQVS